MKSFLEYLSEALLPVDDADINKIYAPFAKPFRDLQEVWKKHVGGKGHITPLTYDSLSKNLMSREFREVISKYDTGKPLKIIDSSELKSDLAKQAHEINPVKIYTQLLGKGNFYRPTSSMIFISLEDGIYHAMTGFFASIPYSQMNMLRNETLDIRVKSTIRHELTHWLDDSLHNLYLTRATEKAMAAQQAGEDGIKVIQKMLWGGERDAYLGSHEITAYTNQIAYLQQKLGKAKYDKLTWADVLTLIPSLESVNRRLGRDFRRKIFTRLSREGLLGASFRKSLE